jgi:hypothetical protein
MSAAQLKRWELQSMLIPGKSAEHVRDRVRGFAEYRLQQFTSVDKAIEFALLDAYTQGLLDGVQVAELQKRKA